MVSNGAVAPRSTHTVIIGGGIIGASTLYYSAKHAARRDAADSSRITLIEGSKELAPAASGKSGGFLALDWHGSSTASLAELSYDLHNQLAKEGSGTKRWGYREVETLQVKVDTSRKGGKAPKQLHWVDPSIVTSSSSMGGSGTTAQVTPKHLVEYLVESAQQEPGIDVRLGTTATGLETNADGRVKGLRVKNSRGAEETIDCDRIVVTAGPWTGSLIKSLSSTSPSSALFRKARTIDGSRAHSVVIRGTGPTSEHCLFTAMRYGDGGRQAGEPEVYARSDGTTYVCGGGDDEPLPPTADEVTYDQAKTAKLIEQTRVLSPDVLGEKATVVKEQACYLPGGSFNGPLIDGDANKGIYVAAGHTCWGITLGPGTGKVMSELLYDGEVTSASIDKLRA